MADDPKQPSLFNRILATVTPGPASQYGPSITPAYLGSMAASLPQKAVDGIDTGLYNLQQFGKQAERGGPLPEPLMFKVNHAIEHGLDYGQAAAKNLIQRYSEAPAPPSPAPPTAPSYATDPEDKGKSLGIAIQRPGGWY